MYVYFDIVVFFLFFFFFKQKTAYEMRISDWSSDVCSSDLRPSRLQLGDGPYPHRRKKLYSYLTRVPDTSARGGQCRPTGWGSSPLPAPSSPPRCARHCTRRCVLRPLTGCLRRRSCQRFRRPRREFREWLQIGRAHV